MSSAATVVYNRAPCTAAGDVPVAATDARLSVLRQGMTLTAIGVAAGLAGAMVASRALITLLFGVSRLDAVTYAGVVVVLLAVSAAACLLPAWRAARVDPAITLRAE